MQESEQTQKEDKQQKKREALGSQHNVFRGPLSAGRVQHLGSGALGALEIVLDVFVCACMYVASRAAL